MKTRQSTIITVRNIKYIQKRINKGCRFCDIPKPTDCNSVNCGGYIYKRLTIARHLNLIITNMFKR